MDGRDLVHILEGRTDLRDALKAKIERAAQEGIVFTPFMWNVKRLQAETAAEIDVLLPSILDRAVKRRALRSAAT
jgi:hypothetical protein